MDSLLTPILSYVLLYKYAAIFFVVYTGAVIVPWPANGMLLAVGAFASQGYIGFWTSLAVAVVANTLGDVTDYWIARAFGDRFIHRFRIDKVRFFLNLKEELITDAGVTVFTTRFAGSLSSVANFLAGFVEVPFGKFLFFDMLGNVIEPFGALALGYAVGNYWADFSNTLSLVAAIVAAAVLLFVLSRIYRRMARRYAEAD